MSIWSESIAAALGTLRAATSDTYTYSRGALSLDNLAATPAASREEATNDNGVTIQSTQPDFLIAAADLVLNANVVEPEPGDRLTRNGKTFEVMTDAAGQRCFYYSDPGHTQIRVHTKEVSS